MRLFSLRAIFLLGFIVAMPVLALPSVARRIDGWLYGAPPADFGRPPAPPPLTVEPITATAATSNLFVPQRPSGLPASQLARSPVAPARFDEPSPALQNMPPSATAASRVEAPTPPPLPPSSPFAAAGDTSASAVQPPETNIDDHTIARLQQIRHRLEQLGAEYVLVDTQDSGRFRFHCRMLAEMRSQSTRSFDAISFDPIAAGEQVLSDVEKWRTTAATVPFTAAP